MRYEIKNKWVLILSPTNEVIFDQNIDSAIIETNNEVFQFNNEEEVLIYVKEHNLTTFRQSSNIEDTPYEEIK